VFGAEAYVSGLAEYLESFFVSKGLSTAVAAHTYPRWEGWSGTEARKIGWSYHGHHPAVKQYGKERIALLGGESSGKTTLAEALSVKFNFSVAYEYGRELYEQRQGKLYYEDMYEIAKRQVDRENCLSSLGEVNYSVCDSTPLTTLWYATKMFDYPPDSRLVELATNRGYENVFICTNDFPFVQDGTRQNMEFAKEMFDYYKSAYPAAPILTGSVESRVNQVSQYLGVSND
jgi:nicotinamide riboside kinase